MNPRIASLVLAAFLAAPLQAQQLDPLRSFEAPAVDAPVERVTVHSAAAEGSIGALLGAPAAGLLALFPTLILFYDTGTCHANSIDSSCYAGHTLLGLASGAGAAFGSKWSGGEAAFVPSLIGGVIGGMIGGALYFRHEYYTSDDPWTSAPSNSVKLASLIPGAVGAYIGNRIGQ